MHIYSPLDAEISPEDNNYVLNSASMMVCCDSTYAQT